MARTVEEIRDAMLVDHAADSTLSIFNSASVTAIYKVIYTITAAGIFTLETLFDMHKAEVEVLKEEARAHSPAFYQNLALEFQDGDALTLNAITLIFEYNPVVEANQIIKVASVKVNDSGGVFMKVAKLDGGGLPIPLTTPEKDRFTEYMVVSRDAGVRVAIISDIADDLRLILTVQRDALVLNPDGTLVSDGVTKPVDDAIDNHVVNLPFDGILNLTDLVDQLQAISGVVDVVVDLAESRFSTNPFVAFAQNYNPQAGYMAFDGAGSTINYQTTLI